MPTIRHEWVCLAGHLGVLDEPADDGTCADDDVVELWVNAVHWSEHRGCLADIAHVGRVVDDEPA